MFKNLLCPVMLYLELKISVQIISVQIIRLNLTKQRCPHPWIKHCIEFCFIVCCKMNVELRDVSLLGLEMLLRLVS